MGLSNNGGGRGRSNPGDLYCSLRLCVRYLREQHEQGKLCLGSKFHTCQVMVTSPSCASACDKSIMEEVVTEQSSYHHGGPEADRSVQKEGQRI